MKKGKVVFLVSVVTQLVLAVVVEPELAKKAAENWLASSPQFGSAREALSVSKLMTQNGTPYHVVNLVGGGFVVTSGDTDTAPIIAFSPAGEFIEGEQNPLWCMLNSDLNSRLHSLPLMANVVGGSAMTLSPAAAKWCKLTNGKTQQNSQLLMLRYFLPRLRVSKLLAR